MNGYEALKTYLNDENYVTSAEVETYLPDLDLEGFKIRLQTVIESDSKKEFTKIEQNILIVLMCDMYYYSDGIEGEAALEWLKKHCPNAYEDCVNGDFAIE